MPRRAPLPTLAGLALALTTAAVGAAQEGGTQRVAVIDVQQIITESAAGKAALAGLEELSRERQAGLEARRQELVELRDRITDGRLSLAEERLAELEKQLEDGTIELQRLAGDAQREVEERQQELLQDIERRVLPIIDELGRQGGYSLIFRKFESGLVFAAEGLDITAQVIARLDAAAGVATGGD